MNKRLNLLLISSLLFACALEPLEKITLNQNYYQNAGMQDFQLAQEFTSLVEAEDSFLVYVHSPTCSPCLNFNPYLEAFSATNEIYVYRLNVSILEYTSLNDVVKYTPTVVLFSEGKVKYLLDGTSNEKKAFTSEAAFSEWFFARVDKLDVNVNNPNIAMIN